MISRIVRWMMQKIEEKERLVRKQDDIEENHREIVTTNCIYRGLKGK